MASKTIRCYISTFVDVEVNTDDYNSTDEMVEYVKENVMDTIDVTELYENAVLTGEVEVSED